MPGLFLLVVLQVAIGIAVTPSLAAGGPPVIRVGSELEFPPYSFVDEKGQPAGFAVELIRAVAYTMGLPIEISSAPWDNVWNALVNRRIDVLPIAAQLPGRRQLVDFSLPHTETYDAFFVRNGAPLIPNIDAARGKEVAVMRSDAAHHALVERQFPGRLFLVDTIPEGLSLVSSAKYDAFLCSKVIGTLAIKEHGIKGLAAGPPIPDYKRVFSFAVKKGDAELLEKLNQGLLIVKTNGDYERIYEKWLSSDEPWRRMKKYLMPAAVGGVAVVLVVGIWLTVLRRMIKVRTAELAVRNELLQRSSEERRRSEEEVRRLNLELERRVNERTEELRESEEQTRQRNVVLDGIGRILRLTLTSATEEELGRGCLAVAEEVTGSRFGFIGEVGRDGHVHDLAISDPGWEHCTMYDKTGHRRPPGDFKLHGLYGRVILDGRGFFTNDPPSHPDSIGTPAGHPALTAFLAAPLVQDGSTIGMVGMGNREGGYRQEDLDALTVLAGAMVEAILRKRAEEALKASVAEKETLLRELAHRTKNNMQVIGSLLSLQAVATQDKKLFDALSDTQDRIRAMALVHENLYRSGNLSSLNMKNYAKDLLFSLLHAHQGTSGPVRTELNLEDIQIPIEAALPCGLIINELVSNSLKHAFPGGTSGTIHLSLRRQGEQIELRYRDDGPGLPKELDLARSSSLGLKLVYNLAVRQLRGSMDVRREQELEFVFTFGGFEHMERT